MFKSAHLYRYRYLVCIQRRGGFASEEGNVILPWAHDAHYVVIYLHNGGFFSDIIMLTQLNYPRGTRLNAMKRFCICSL